MAKGRPLGLKFPFDIVIGFLIQSHYLDLSRGNYS
jgi:hypothetical protein